MEAYDRETGMRTLTRRSGSSNLAGIGPLITQLAMLGGHRDSSPVSLLGSYDESGHLSLEEAQKLGG